MRPKALLVLALILTLLLGHGVIAAAPGPAEAPRRPNIIFVLTDDLDSRSIADHEDQFPTLRRLREQGTAFRNFFVSLSLCCPSRTSILRGQYAHNTEIFTNDLPGGGFAKVFQRGLEGSTVATWLHDAGYRTVLLGKYLNGYPSGAGVTYVPPGWDEWYSPARGDPYSEFNYTLNENGRLVAYGSDPQDYLTNVLGFKATDFI
jgi:N-acetylglucosamine-6-sulfatase